MEYVENQDFSDYTSFARKVVWSESKGTTSDNDKALMQIVDDAVERGVEEQFIVNLLRDTSPANYERKCETLKVMNNFDCMG